jgi:hypothetical protein
MRELNHVSFDIEESEKGVPLTVAAHALGLGYLATRDRLLRGELTGFRRRGRWYVSGRSLADALGSRPDR